MDELVTVATYDSLPVAELAQSRLQDEGIQAVLADANLIAMHSFLSFAVGGIKLRVRRSDVARAEAILSEAKFGRRAAADSTPSGPIRFYCGDCGAVLEFPSSRRGGVETCKRCGEYVDVPGSSDPTLVAADGSPVEPLAIAEAPFSAIAEKPATATTRRIPLLIEIPAVLSFVYLPHLVHSLPVFGPYSYGLAADMTSFGLAADMTLLLMGSVQSVIPLLLMLALAGEGWGKFGIVPFRWLLDCSMAFVIWFADNLLLMFVYLPFALATSEPAVDEAYISSWQSGLVCLLGLSANSVAEELAMRGYLITRLEELWHSPWLAVVLSAALFASYHAHYGLWGTVSVAVTGLVYGAFYVWQRRLWPLMIAHTVYNLAVYI